MIKEDEEELSKKIRDILSSGVTRKEDSIIKVVEKFVDSKEVTKRDFYDIFDRLGEKSEWEGDNAMQGLTIIGKYIKEGNLIKGASKNQIFSVDVSILINAGIKKKDTEDLVMLNWMIEDDCLSCFV
jgi:hypothetical protein